MYTYYFLALHTSDIWWKPYLTTCQIIQFMLMNAQAVYLLYTSCTEYPKKLIYTYFAYVASLLVLFANFFIMSYIIGRDKKDARRSRGKNDLKSN